MRLVYQKQKGDDKQSTSGSLWLPVLIVLVSAAAATWVSLKARTATSPLCSGHF